MERIRQTGQGPWDPRNDKVLNSLGFLFASYVSDLELKILATQK